MKKIVSVLVIAGLFLGFGIPAVGNARDYGVNDGMYWSRQDLDDLLSPQVLRTLNLTGRQRNSLDELLRRDWGYSHNSNLPSGLLHFLNFGRPGGRIIIEEQRDGRDVFLALLGFGVLLSQMQDSNAYYYEYDYGHNYVRIDDFLYLFFQLLDMNQRRVFRIHFDSWYDNRYYNRSYRNYDNYWRDWSRELEHRLRLSERQRLQMERELRQYYERKRGYDRRYREAERDYFRKNWDRSKNWNIEHHRKELQKIRRQEIDQGLKTTERFDSLLDATQRKAFESLRLERDRGNFDQKKNPSPVIRRVVEPEQKNTPPALKKPDPGQQKKNPPALKKPDPGQQKKNPPALKKPGKDKN